MNNTIVANDLKVKGVKAISEALETATEAIISIRGKNRFVVLPIEAYNHFREWELDSALAESKRDIKNGNFIVESVDKHIKRITSD